MSDRLSRRRFLRGLAAVAGGTALAACAPQVVKETVVVEKVVEKPVEKIVEKVVEKVVTAAPAAAEPPTEIRWSHWWGEQHKQWLPVVEEKANVKVKEEIYPWGEYTQKVLTQVAGGVAPDIIQLDQGHNSEFFSKDIFVPYDDLLDELYASGELIEAKWNVDPGLEMGYKGKTLALSLFTMQGRSVYLNLDRVEAAGYPMDELPLWGTPLFDTWDWGDFVEFLKAVTQKKSDGTYEQYGYSGAISDAGSLIYQMASYGADMVDDPWFYEDTEALLDQPDAIQAAHDLVDLTIVHGVAPTLEAQQGIEGGLFRANMACANISWTNQTWIVAELPFKLGFMHLPYTEQRVHGIGANHLCINKAGKSIPQSQRAAVIQTTDHEVGQRLLDLAGTISAYDPASYNATLPAGDVGVVARIMLSRLEGMSQCSYCTKDVNKFNRAGYGRAGRYLQNTLNAELQEALTGQKTVDQAMKDADALIDTEIKSLM